MTFTTDTRAHHQPIAGLAKRITDAILARKRRRSLIRLLDLEDHMLDDIGVTRAEVTSASHLPLSVNAAEELRRISLERRKRAM